MNNRIDELAIQAGAKIETAHWVYYDDFSYQKFAELMVFECTKVILFGGYRNSALGEKQQLTPPEIAKMVKQHFGVEE